MIYDKGIKEFVEAAIILKKYVNIEFNLYGNPDKYNPSSIPIQTLNEWNTKKSSIGGVLWKILYQSITSHTLLCYQAIEKVCLK